MAQQKSEEQSIFANKQNGLNWMELVKWKKQKQSNKSEKKFDFDLNFEMKTTSLKTYIKSH